MSGDCEEEGHEYYVEDDYTEMYCDWRAEGKPWVHTHVTVKCERCGVTHQGDWSWIPDAKARYVMEK